MRFPKNLSDKKVSENSTDCSSSDKEEYSPATSKKTETKRKDGNNIRLS